LQDENARLKKLVAELSLDKAILQDMATKNWHGPALKRRAAECIVIHNALDTRWPADW
jgi:putative transposase